MIISKARKINGFSSKNRFLVNEVLNFSRALRITNFRNEGGVLELVTLGILVLEENSLETLEDLASVLDFLG